MGMSYEELEQSLIRIGRNLVEAEKREDNFYQAAREAQQRLEERTTERDYHMRMADKLAERIREMVPALKEAERFMAYFSGETGGTFVGPGTPQSCLEQIRAAIRSPEGGGRWQCGARKQVPPLVTDWEDVEQRTNVTCSSCKEKLWACRCDDPDVDEQRFPR